MRRGEVWWADLAAPVGRRPVLLLSRNEAYDRRLSVTVAPLTRTIRGIATEVEIGPAEDMPGASVANLDDILTVRKSRLRSRITQLAPEQMRAVRAAIVFALDLGPDA